MADPQADRCDVDEAEVAFGGFVIAGGNAAGILELVEAPLDKIAQAIEGPIHDDAQPAGLAHWLESRSARPVNPFCQHGLVQPKVPCVSPI